MYVSPYNSVFQLFALSLLLTRVTSLHTDGVTDLYTYVDSFADISALTLSGQSLEYIPRDREWLKNALFRFLKSQAG